MKGQLIFLGMAHLDGTTRMRTQVVWYESLLSLPARYVTCQRSAQSLWHPSIQQ